MRILSGALWSVLGCLLVIVPAALIFAGIVGLFLGATILVTQWVIQ
jgi:hypothetical protein